MAAAPFKSTITIVGKNGEKKQMTLTASDVNAAALTFPSGGTELPIMPVDCKIIDWINAPAGGTDTTNMSVYIGGAIQPFILSNGANLGTVFNRQVQANNIYVPAGVAVKFVQNT